MVVDAGVDHGDHGPRRRVLGGVPQRRRADAGHTRLDVGLDPDVLVNLEHVGVPAQRLARGAPAGRRPCRSGRGCSRAAPDPRRRSGAHRRASCPIASRTRLVLRVEIGERGARGHGSPRRRAAARAAAR
jgi:hypothetical protein